MISTPDGSQPKVNPKQFLDAKVASMIEDLKRERTPSIGDIALKGEEGQSIQDKVRAGIIKI
tara:strand:+ start:145 stop:330 length:186 start_codon:yes stop_codon:yes gene_type:complete